jgi:hypothetical protein
MVRGFVYTECPKCGRDSWTPRRFLVKAKGREYWYLQYRHPKDRRRSVPWGKVCYARTAAEPAAKPKRAKEPRGPKPQIAKLDGQEVPDFEELKERMTKKK